MKVLLIYPPASDPRGPHLSLPCLSAFLRDKGHTVEMWDLDLELSGRLMQPGILREALKRCEDKMAVIDNKKVKGYGDASYWHFLFQACRTGKNLPGEITAAVEVLQSVEFYDRNRFRWARKTINSALNLISLSFDPGLKYQIDNQIFETPYRTDFSPDLEKAVADDEANLFGSLYTAHILPRVARLRPDLVGISILNYQQIVPGLTLSWALKRAGWKVFIGGTVFVKLISALQQETGFFNFCNGVIVYEGETALLRLVEALEEGDNLEDVPHLIFSSDGRVKINTPFTAENLNELPTPDFDGLPLGRYLAPHPVLPYNLGKGCHWAQCYFCDIPYSHVIGENSYRVKRVELIADQLEELSSRYATPYFQFTDESCPPELLASISTELLKRKCNVRYICYGRFDKGFSEDLCRHIYRGGCRKILFGLESGCQRRLDALNKGIAVRQAEAILKNCAGAGIHYKVFAMIGLPHETVDEAYETFSFFKRNRYLFLSPFNHFEFSPFHLDRHSCLGKKPETYGLQRVPGGEGPFSLGGWAFETQSGMQPGTVKKLCRHINQELYHLLKADEKFSGWEEYALLTIDRLDKDGVVGTAGN